MNINIIQNSNTPPKLNTTFSLIGLCVSYNYFDTLQFMLPVNYLHFNKIYIITQPDDIETIEFCHKFNNVVVLYYNLRNNNKKFDKYGALNFAQKKAYIEYPDSWYLIIDSDILLPNNFIDILNSEKLRHRCIYGAIRNNVNMASELFDKIQIINNPDNINLAVNNILYLKNNQPPAILGCFQLYKKHVYQRENLTNAGHGDYCFGHDNFNIFCNLENIIYLHLGTSEDANWNGKTKSFNVNTIISIEDMYYMCCKKINNSYYNKKRKLIQ